MNMSTLTLRARFPSGQTVTLTNLAPTTTYSTLLSELTIRANLPSRPQKLLLAGPPRTPLSPPPDTPLSAFLQSGDALIVEPITALPARRRPRRPKTSAPHPKQSTSTPRPRIATLASSAKRACSTPIADIAADVDDPRDATWQPGHDSDDASPKPTSSKRARRGRARPSASNVATGESRCGEIEVDKIDPLDLGAQQGALGAALVQTLIAGEVGNVEDGVGGMLRTGLQEGLKGRVAEADGERRYEALLAGRVRYTDVAGGRGFRVEFRAVGERGWRKEFEGRAVARFGRETLVGAVSAVLESAEDRWGLRPLEMAARSPRVFWNLARLFGKDIEDGLRELVPDGDWRFLEERRRVVSEKGRRNEENKKHMGWDSDT